MTADVPPVEHRVLVRADIEPVFDAITTAEGLDSWFTTGSEVDRRVGGMMTWRWLNWGPDKDTAEDSGPILEMDRPHRFVFQWTADIGPTTITLDFEEVEEGTVVSLEHSGCPTAEAALSFAAGWGEALALMKFKVEHDLTY